MVAAHDVADDVGALPMLGVGEQPLAPHREEDSALDWFQSVPHVRQRSARDDRERVVQVPGLCDVMERHQLPSAASLEELRLVARALARPYRTRRPTRRPFFFGRCSFATQFSWLRPGNLRQVSRGLYACQDFRRFSGSGAEGPEKDLGFRRSRSALLVPGPKLETAAPIGYGGPGWRALDEAPAAATRLAKKIAPYGPARQIDRWTIRTIRTLDSLPGRQLLVEACRVRRFTLV